MPRESMTTGTPWERLVGYARAVKLGSTIYVSGTTATNAQGEIVSPGDAYGQTVQTIRNIQAALRALGADLPDVVRTRIYVANIDDWEAVGRAHGEFFGAVCPACTLVEVSRLIAPDMLVEMEADACCTPE